MFIELTDHLRCPAEHPESFLVLLPDRMTGRRVEAGSLGCPTCGAVVTIAGGEVDFGRPGTRADSHPTHLGVAGIVAMLGISGPGGYVAIIGSGGSLGAELAAALPGVRLVLINPPAGTSDSESASVLRATRSPLKTKSMRGVVVSADYGADAAWVDAAIAATLPGLRVVVEGPSVERAGLDVLAAAAGVWVGRVDPKGR